MVFRHHLEADFQRGEAIGANLRGTIPDAEGHYFKGLTPGTKREDGFFWFQQGKGIVQQVVLAESGIDALSYAALHKRQQGGTVYLSTDGNGTIPTVALQQVLEGGGTVILAQDNDRDGHRQAWEIARQFSEFRLIRQVHSDWVHVFLTIEFQVPYDARIEALQTRLSSYNTMLSTLDEIAGQIELMEKELRSYSEKMLMGVATRYGKDSLQYMQAGGKQRKASKRSLVNAAPTTKSTAVVEMMAPGGEKAKTNGKGTKAAVN